MRTRGPTFPIPTAAAVFNTTQNSAAARFTWQATPRNKFFYSFENQWRRWFDRARQRLARGDPGLPLPAGVDRRGWRGRLPLTSRLLLDARFSNHAEVFRTSDPRDFDPTIIPVVEQSSGLIYRNRGLTNPCCLQTFDMPHIYNMAASLAYVTGAHALKVGFADIVGIIRLEHHFNDYAMSYRFNNGVPNQLTQYYTPATERQQPRRRAGLLRAGQVDAQAVDDQRGRALRLLRHGISRTAPRAGRLAAQPEPHVSREQLVRLQGPLPARGGRVRRVRHRADRHPGQCGPVHPGHQPGGRQSGHQPGYQRHPVVDRRQPGLRAELRPRESSERTASAGSSRTSRSARSGPARPTTRRCSRAGACGRPTRSFPSASSTR